MLPREPPYIKLCGETQKNPFGDIEYLTKLTHDPLPPYHRGLCVCQKRTFLTPILDGEKSTEYN